MDLEIKNKGDEFYSRAVSRETQESLVIMIMDITKANPVENLSNKQCRTVLSKLQALSQFYDFEKIYRTNPSEEFGEYEDE